MTGPSAIACCMLLVATGCGAPSATGFTAAHRRALGDTVLTLFDSLSAIHTAHPDTGMLRRLHPPEDTLVFIEGAVTERLTGDSLFRRVRALHVPVSAMDQRFTNRTAFLLDSNTGWLSATESVHWQDTAGVHDWHALLTLVISRRRDRWVIRAYRG